jgi:hypothetical protein
MKLLLKLIDLTWLGGYSYTVGEEPYDSSLTGGSLATSNTLYMTLLSNYRSYDQHDSDVILSHPVLRSKLDAHRMCAHDQDFTHTAKITAFQIKPVS